MSAKKDSLATRKGMVVRIDEGRFVRCHCQILCDDCRIRFKCYTSEYLESEDVAHGRMAWFVCLERVDEDEIRSHKRG